MYLVSGFYIEIYMDVVFDIERDTNARVCGGDTSLLCSSM